MEFDGLEGEIEKLVQEREDLMNKLNSGELSGDDASKTALRLNQVAAEIEYKEGRWLELA